MSRGLVAVIELSSCLNEPAAKFLAFANLFSSSCFSFNLSKSFLDIKTSPLTTMSIFSFNFLGIFL